MGAGAGEAESAGGRARAAGAQVSGYAGAAGRGGGRVAWLVHSLRCGGLGLLARFINSLQSNDEFTKLGITIKVIVEFRLCHLIYVPFRVLN